MTSVRTTQLLNNSLGLVGQDLKDVLSALAKSINSILRITFHIS
ncbi:TPA: hypothetical protein ACG1ZL_001486 [Streptococcus agalactiae]